VHPHLQNTHAGHSILISLVLVPFPTTVRQTGTIEVRTISITYRFGFFTGNVEIL
jgi:hypothetical protein